MESAGRSEVGEDGGPDGRPGARQVIALTWPAAHDYLRTDDAEVM